MPREETEVEFVHAPWRWGAVVLASWALAVPPPSNSFESRATATAQPLPLATANKAAPSKPRKKVDINNATLSELRALPLGEVEAKKVIEHRPYKARGELMTKAGLPEGVYFAVKDRLQLQAPRKKAVKK